MEKFDFDPAEWIPFKDKQVIERVRNIRREDIEKHPNPDFKIRVVPDRDVEWIFIADMLGRLRDSDAKDEKVVLILPNPCHAYSHLALMINRLRINCRNLHVFAMDEWADQDGNIAPESWPMGFGHALKKHFYFNVDEDLRPPERQITLFTDKNISNYGKMIADTGGADACYSGSGWAGHIAFIDPDVPEWSDDLEEWKTQGARVVHLHPLTIAQNSLHGCFGMSGDLTAVPPRAATIGPAEVIGSRYRMDMNALTTQGTFSSWQRFTTRLVAHGPVTPKIPTSILQTLSTDFYISETCAANVEPVWDKEY